MPGDRQPSLLRAVDLWWHDLDGVTPDVVYVEGHVTPEQHDAALAAATAYLTDVAGRTLDDEDYEAWSPPRLGVREHLWGLLEAPHDDEETDLDSVWHVFSTDVPGSRPVTRVIDLDFWAAIAAAQRAERARAEQLADYVRRWYPEATDVSARGFPADGGCVRWRMPGLVGDVTWSAGEPDAVYVQQRDLDAWSQYAGRPRPEVP